MVFKKYVVHAEQNAILNARGKSLEGCRIYVNLFPCHVKIYYFISKFILYNSITLSINEFIVAFPVQFILFETNLALPKIAIMKMY